MPNLGTAPSAEVTAQEPQIIPIQDALAAARGVTISNADTADLDARAEALRRRAAALRQRQVNQ